MRFRTKRNIETEWVGDRYSAYLKERQTERVIAHFFYHHGIWEMCACLPLWRSWAVNRALDLAPVGRLEGLTRRWVFFRVAHSADEAIRFLSQFSEDKPQVGRIEFEEDDAWEEV